MLADIFEAFLCRIYLRKHLLLYISIFQNSSALRWCRLLESFLLNKSRTIFPAYSIQTTATDVLATQKARASAAKMLTLLRKRQEYSGFTTGGVNTSFLLSFLSLLAHDESQSSQPHHQTSNISRIKSPNYVSHLFLQLSLPNPLKPGVKSRMKM